jgi:hypothetical protein
MPCYFILALPFYLIGELGLFSFIGIVLFVLLLKDNNFKQVNFLLIATSLFFLWEICSRSNIFTNASFIVISIFYLLKNYSKTVKSNLIYGSLIGFLLSTRNVFAIPYIITFMYLLNTKKIDFKNMVYVGAISTSIFSLTFLPFIWNHLIDFKQMNPFIIQSSFLMPFKFNLLFIFLAFGFSFLCKKEIDIYFFSGITLFLTILFYSGYIIYNSNFNTAFFESVADISYFILCVPFLLFYFFKTNE